jgi:hypothetical protein
VPRLPQCADRRSQVRSALRTLSGKVRLANGKRTLEDNGADFIKEGRNGMPSYR